MNPRLFGVFLWIALVCALVSASQDIVAPGPSRHSLPLFLKNLLLCHVAPFWILSSCAMLKNTSRCTFSKAAKCFFYYYLRDIFILELANMYASKVVPGALLYENGSLFMSNVRLLLDFEVVQYVDLDSLVAADVRVLGWKLPNIPTFLSRFLWAFMPIRLFSSLYMLLNVVYGISELPILFPALINGAFHAVPLVICRIVVCFFKAFAVLRHNVGRASLFSPHYRDYHILVAMPKKERRRLLDGEYRDTLDAKARRLFDARLRERAEKHARFKMCRREAKRVHQRALLKIQRAEEASAESPSPAAP
jgi:hypothetical protein